MVKNYLNYYKLLGVEPNATTEEIEKAYKVKAKEYHPDKNQEQHTATTLFQYIQEAKRILTDPKSRLEYDYEIGIKKKPQPKPIIIKKTVNTDALLIVGFIGVLVGLTIGISQL